VIKILKTGKYVLEKRELKRKKTKRENLNLIKSFLILSEL